MKSPYGYWPQCDVDGCKGVSCDNGSYWRPGYWCLCPIHSQMAREGKPKPKMWDWAVRREDSRLPDGTLPHNRDEL